jgi:hypothetical protein
MANNPNRNKLRREFEREEAWWNGLTEEQKQVHRELEDLRSKLRMAEFEQMKAKSAAWDALPKEDRDTWHRVNKVLNLAELEHSPVVSRAKSALEQAERRAKSLTGTN